jgi:hypothetical protein
VSKNFTFIASKTGEMATEISDFGQ